MKLNLLKQSGTLESLFLNYIIRLLGLKRITKKFWHRWIASGAEYSDIIDTLNHIKGFDNWCHEWSITARKYETLAINAKKQNSKITAESFFLKANVYYYLAQWAIFENTKEKQEAYLNSKRCFLEASAYFSAPLQEVKISCNELEMPCYLRIPNDNTKDKFPAVLFIHGMDSAKEEVYWTEREAIMRGFVTLVFDGPGQGEMYILNNIRWDEKFEVYVQKALDFLCDQPNIDEDKIFVCGLSWGGFWALKVASMNNHLKGCISVGGPPSLDHFKKLPLPIRVRFQKLFGDPPPEEVEKVFAKFNIFEEIDKIQCPTLIVHGKKDVLVPFELIEKMIKKMRCDITFKVYEDGDHCCTQHAAEIRGISGDWLVKHL